MIGAGLVPEPTTAKQMAAKLRWTEARAKHVLEGFVKAGIAQRAPDDSYIITGMGLGVGERLGVVKPLDPKLGGWAK